MENKPKILFLDLETSPLVGYAWRKWEADIIDLQKDWELLSFAYKWSGDDKVKCRARPHYKDKTDKSLTKDLWKLFHEADFIVAHNGRQFDEKKAKAKFVEHGLPPPSPYKSIDTLSIAKTQFSFTSNKLDDLGKILGVGRKKNVGGFGTWLGCMNGDRKSWATMMLYNKQDVSLLERVYMRIRAWAPRHPDVSLWQSERYACDVCASKSSQFRGWHKTKTRKTRRHQCNDCGHWFLGKSEKR